MFGAAFRRISAGVCEVFLAVFRAPLLQPCFIFLAVFGVIYALIFPHSVGVFAPPFPRIFGVVFIPFAAILSHFFGVSLLLSRWAVNPVERSMQRAPVLSRRGQQLVDGEGRHVWRFDGRTASRALELMGRHLGLFAENSRRQGDVALSISWEGVDGRSVKTSGTDAEHGDEPALVMTPDSGKEDAVFHIMPEEERS